MTTTSRRFAIALAASVLVPYSLLSMDDDFDLDLTDLDDILSEDIVDYYRVPVPISPGDIDKSLILQANALTLLQQNLYNATNPLRTRNPLDLPFFLPRLHYIRATNCQIQLFWNQTSAMNFTQCSTSISSYLGIKNPNIIEQLIFIEESVPNLFSIGPVDVLELFQHTKIQERKLGAMFSVEHNYRPFTFSASFPFYYAERNFFLSNDEQNAIEAALGKASEDETFDFARKHLIGDKLGLGDTRFSFTFDAFQKDNLKSRVGVFTTIPTAFAFMSKLLGNSFPQQSQSPTLNLSQLVAYALGTTQTDKNIALQMGQEFFLGAVDHLAANVLNCDLGYRGHVGLGTHLVSQTPLTFLVKRPWADSFHFRSRIALQYLFPGNEKRFFVDKSESPEFAALGLDRPLEEILTQIDTDPAYALEVLNFFQDRITEIFYPLVCKSRVSPGVVFQWTSRFWYTHYRWNAYVGTDTWVQGPEKITRVKCCSDSPSFVPDIARAVVPYAYQGKIMLGIGYTVERPTRTLLMMLHTDSTYSNSGIGQDFTISLVLETNF